MASVLLRGNALAEIVTDARGAVVGLKPIPWEWVSVQMLGSGRLVYDVVETIALYGSTGRPRRLLQDEVLHLKDRSDDGLIGRSRLQRAAAVVQSGMSIQSFGGDPAARWQSWKIAVEAGILSPDEVREEEGWNPGAPPKSAPASAT
jgi:phage portal protein BeeE